MIDPITALTLTICSKNPLVIKVLGPTADYIGEGIKSLTEKRTENLKKIFSRAYEKLNNQMASTGTVPPRVLKCILDEGGYVDNELAAEYFSGVLAASKSDRARDDRSITILKLLSSMSNYEIRLHYIFYNSFREKFLDSNEFNITEASKCMKHQLFFSLDEFINSFVIEQSEDPNSILEHAFPGLANRNLIGKNCAYGGKDFLFQRFNYVSDQGGIIASPSLLGAQLFLAAHGHLDISVNQLCDSSLTLEIWDEIKPLKGVMINQ